MVNYTKFKDMGVNQENQQTQQENQQTQQEDNRFMVAECDTQQSKQTFIQSHRVAVCKIYTDWCGPCKSLAEPYLELAKKHNKREQCFLFKQNAENKNVQCSVSSVPAFEIYLEGKLVKKVEGGIRIKDLEELITNI